MRILIGSDKYGRNLKEHLMSYLKEEGHEVIDVTKQDLDFADSADILCKGIHELYADRGILIDSYGQGSFMCANKHKGIICAVVSDEHSAYMTRMHNNAQIIALGSEIVGNKLAESIVDSFLSSEYAGGRHQIRVDMLNKML